MPTTCPTASRSMRTCALSVPAPPVSAWRCNSSAPTSTCCCWSPEAWAKSRIHRRFTPARWRTNACMARRVATASVASAAPPASGAAAACRSTTSTSRHANMCRTAAGRIAREALMPYYPRANRLCEAGDFAYTAQDAFHGRARPIIDGFESPYFSSDTLERFSCPTDFSGRYAHRLAAAHNITVLLHANVTHLQLRPRGRSCRRARRANPEGQTLHRARRAICTRGRRPRGRALIACEPGRAAQRHRQRQ